MSIASEITRLQNSKADVKTIVNKDKDLINNGTAFIASETVDDYNDLIEDMQDAYKKFIPIQNVTGTTSVSLDNTNNDKALTSIQIDGNITQTTYTGKNLVPLNGITTQTINQLTITNMGDGTIKVNGTANATTRLDVSYTQTLTANATYIFSNANTRGSAGANVNIQDSSNNVIGSITLNNSTGSFTPTSNVTIAKVRFYIDNGQSFSDYILKVQLEKGSSATSFEPYVGGIASPSPSYPQVIDVVTGENTLEVTGKNLLDLSQVEIGKVWNDSDNPNRAVVYIECEQSTTYTISITSAGSIDEVWYFEKDSTRTNRTDGNTQITTTYTKTTKDNSYYIGLQFNKTNIASSDFTGVKIQIEQGSTATTYKAYESENYPINLASKNLFNKDDVTAGYRLGSDGQNYAHEGYNVSDYIRVMPNTNYVASWTMAWDETVCTYTASKQFVRRMTSGTTFTTSDSEVYIRIAVADARLSTAQVEKGTTSSTYASWFTPIELCKISTYKDYIYKSGGKWYKHGAVGKVVLDGTVDYTVSSGTGYYEFSYYSLTPNAVNSYVNSITDYFYNSSTNRCMTKLSSILIRVPSEANITTNNEFKTWLGTHNVTVYYPLATATDTEITNTALVSQLEAVSLLAGDQNNFIITGDTDVSGLKINYIGEASVHL